MDNAASKVLHALADDYETIASLLSEGPDGQYIPGITKGSLVHSLKTLIDEGYVEVVNWNQDLRKFEKSELSDDPDDHVYVFGLTEKGRQRLDSA